MKRELADKNRSESKKRLDAESKLREVIAQKVAAKYQAEVQAEAAAEETTEEVAAEATETPEVEAAE